MTSFLIIALLALSACAEFPAEPPIDRGTACHEQADAWCEQVGFASSAGCRTWYLHECEPNGPDGTIDPDAQGACLRAIETATTEPPECRLTWRQ